MNEVPGWVIYGQAIGGFAAVFAAIAAWAAVYISHRFRPLRVRSIEIHSRQLKGVITRWMDDLTGPQSPGEPSHIHENRGYITASEIAEPNPYQLPLENDVLFRDLRNHLPKLIEKWEAYKSEVDSYMRDKRQLTCDVLNFIENKSGLRVRDYSAARPERENVWFHWVCEAVYEDLASIAEGRNPRWFVESPSDHAPSQELRKNCELWIGGRLAILYCPSDPQETTSRLYRQLAEAIRNESTLVEKFRQHRKKYECLKKKHQELVDLLREWAKVPILPNEKCGLLEGKLNILK